MGQGTNFVGNHGKTTTLLTRTGRFDSGIQGQQVGVLGDAANHVQHLADLPDIAGQFGHCLVGTGDFGHHVGDACHGLFYL